MRFPHLPPLPCVLAPQKTCAVGSVENVDGTARKDLTDQYAEQLREDLKYRCKWCERIGLGFVLPMCHNFRNQNRLQ